MNAEIKDIVIEILNEKAKKNKDQIEMQHTITGDLGLDSLDIVEIVMALEDKFELTVNEELLAKIQTVQDLVNLIEELKK
jgi:acyl carrier protein